MSGKSDDLTAFVFFHVVDDIVGPKCLKQCVIPDVTATVCGQALNVLTRRVTIAGCPTEST